MTKKYLFIIFVIPFIASACATLLIPQASQINLSYAQAKWNNTTLEDLKEGRNLYIQTCSGCHSLPKPNDFSEEKWIQLIEDMSKEINLSKEQLTKIEKYILTVLNTK